MEENFFLPVNWVDGMKINKTHFIAQDNAAAYQLAQNTNCLLNELNYGLLPALGDGAGIKIFITTDNQKKLQVRIQKCRAITPGGYFIEFNEDSTLQNNQIVAQVVNEPVTLRELKNKGIEFYIVVTINPYKRVPYGSMQSAEVPPRLPFSAPSYFVDLVPVAEARRNALGAFQLPVGKMSIQDQNVILQEDYIPPCTSVSSHPDLLEIQAGLEQFYSKMELYSLQVIQKILQKKQNNEMAMIVQKLCEAICMFTASELAELKSLGIIQPPVYAVSKISSLSRLIKNTFDFYQGSGKEELINYLTEWCNISQGELGRRS